MAKGLVNESSLNSIAEAINVLNGTEGTYLPSEMGAAIIAAIPTEEVTGDIVSITDAAAYPAEGLEFSVEPVQDLHGYDRPWPGGGGKNLFNKDTALNQNFVNSTGNIGQSPDWSASDYIPVESDEQYTLSGVTNYGNIAHHTFYDTNKTFLSSILSTTYTFTTPQNAKYVRLSLKTETPTEVMLNVGSTATSYEPYSNICPISGWTGVNGERTGVNVWDEEWESGGYDNNGSKAANQFVIRAKNKIRVNPNTAYKFVFPSIINSTPVTYRLCQYTLDGICITSTSGLSQHTFTTNAECHYITFNFGPEYGTTYNHDISINYPSTDPDYAHYEPYQGTSIPITFPTEAGTVYGGKVDVVNGKLTVDRGFLTASDDGSWRFDIATGEYKYVYKNNLIIGSSIEKIKCNIAPTVTGTTNLGAARSGGGFIQLWCNGLNIESLSDWKSYITNNNVQFVYELATPIEYDITPQQVQMLLGDNNVWCDTGDTILEYKVDLGRYIEKLITNI